jgi:hypothetical protein
LIHHQQQIIFTTTTMKIAIALLLVSLVGLSLGAAPAPSGCSCISVQNDQTAKTFTVSLKNCPSGLSHVNVPANIPTQGSCPPLTVTLKSTDCPGYTPRSWC